MSLTCMTELLFQMLHPIGLRTLSRVFQLDCLGLCSWRSSHWTRLRATLQFFGDFGDLATEEECCERLAVVQLASSMLRALWRVLCNSNALDMGLSPWEVSWWRWVQDDQGPSKGWFGRPEARAPMPKLEELVWHHYSQAGWCIALGVVFQYGQNGQKPNSRIGAVFGVFCSRMDDWWPISGIGWCSASRSFIWEGANLWCSFGSVSGGRRCWDRTAKLCRDILALCHWADGASKQDNV